MRPFVHDPSPAHRDHGSKRRFDDSTGLSNLRLIIFIRKKAFVALTRADSRKRTTVGTPKASNRQDGSCGISRHFRGPATLAPNRQRFAKESRTPESVAYSQPITSHRITQFIANATAIRRQNKTF
ncbi:hypothetical protein N9C08_03620 [Rubripirellula sp.]|nr:hypothetical protein [Rubripirellula sp.]